MRMSKIFKKLSTIIMIFAMLCGVLPALGCGITAKASDNPVKLYAMEHTMSRYGYSSYDIYIRITAGSAATKAAYVHYSMNDSDEWQDAAATYFTKIDDNTEIWKATVSGWGLGGEYTIKYVGDSQTYWDNNNGSNYTYSDYLGEANIKSLRLTYQTASNYTIQAAVKNLAYTKNVKVRYTQDNWATYQEVPLSYDSSISGTNAEIWSTTLNLDADKTDSFEYCLCYQVNNQTYWDNNFGANYDTSYHRPY